MPVPFVASPHLWPAGLALVDGSGDWIVVGLVSSIAGCFLLGSAILLRHPRDLVREHFGGPRRRLASIRGYVFHRVQVMLGFGLLLAGFLLQLLGRAAGDESSQFPIGWVGLVIVAVGLLQWLGWWVSQQLFRHYVREYLGERGTELETDSGLAREVGELFGVEMLPDDTVATYVTRLRERADLPRPAAGARAPEPAVGRAGLDPARNR
jgi:hypothetical protein